MANRRVRWGQELESCQEILPRPFVAILKTAAKNRRPQARMRRHASESIQQEREKLIEEESAGEEDAERRREVVVRTLA